MAKKLPDYIKEVAEGYEITLSRPLDMSGAKVAVVTMREPLVSDQETADIMEGGDATREIHQFANLIGAAPDDIRKMGLRDYKKLQTAYLAFLV